MAKREGGKGEREDEGVEKKEAGQTVSAGFSL